MNFVDDIPRPTLELSSTKSPLSSDEAIKNSFQELKANFSRLDAEFQSFRNQIK